MRGRMWWLGGILFCGYVAMVLINPAAPGQKLNTPASTYASGPNGTMALELLWQKLRLPWSDWEQVPALLPADSQAVFVSALPDDGVYNAKDVDTILHYAAEGHSVLWVDDGQDSLFSKLAVTISGTGVQQTIHTLVKVHEPVRLDSSISPTVSTLSTTTHATQFSNLDATADAWLTGAGLKQASVLYETPEGHVVGAEFSRGKGNVMLWSMPSIWENATVDKGSNFRLVWDLVGNRGILWDEYGHGYARQSTLGWMFHGWKALAAMVGLLALLLYLYRNLWRFGPVRNPAPGTTMAATDYVEAVAWHLNRRELRPSQFVEIVRLTRLRLSGVPLTALEPDEERLRERIEGVLRGPKRQLWQDWKALADQGYHPRQWRKFLRLTRQLWLQAGLQQKGGREFGQRSFGKHSAD